jgi:hypothetical protein
MDEFDDAVTDDEQPPKVDRPSVSGAVNAKESIKHLLGA